LSQADLHNKKVKSSDKKRLKALQAFIAPLRTLLQGKQCIKNVKRCDLTEHLGYKPWQTRQPRVRKVPKAMKPHLKECL
jgi:hypothetical protein